MKPLINIFLLLMIVFCTSTMPLFLSPIDYSSTINISDNGEDISYNPNVVNFKSNSGYAFTDPDSLILEIFYSGAMELSLSEDTLFSIDVLNDNGLVQSGIDAKMVSSVHFSNNKYLLDKDNPIISTISINQRDYSLPDGQYKLVITPKIYELKNENIEVNVTYTQDRKYIAAMDVPPENTRGITFYLANDDDVLLPISEFIENAVDVYEYRLIESAYTRNHSAYSLKNPTGAVNYLVFQDGIVYIDVKGSDPIYSNNNTSDNAYWAFVKSYMGIGYVERVRFTVDNYVVEEYFGSHQIGSSIQYYNTDKVYLPVIAGERYLLADFNLLNNQGLGTREKIDLMVENMKNGNMTGLASMPKNVSFSYEISGSSVNILFNSDVSLDNYSEDKLNMMMESMIYSFSSISGIDSIYISTFNENITDIGSYSAGVTIYPKNNINPYADEIIKLEGATE
ncbi:hypothetical protein SAMN02745751_01662 [Dethiosulfatibacter aminovorans DSM 17477]|uniref:Sporulation and spore germination n=1 Tax=Dethiosulfatibacter aminovorans DSM 17477 TaxID=1121476 RepID=A0A1M6G9U8_9FIRM|nr:hypothetical protein [Dethiosulfatibacter aminovorans]SHJ06654.1 hypothetical protein SAMN02745751_01662 [Dethiosulfatibacter aminovorans DSM 17477]